MCALQEIRWYGANSNSVNEDKRFNARLIKFTIIFAERTFHIFTVYAPQIGQPDTEKYAFWQQLGVTRQVMIISYLRVILIILWMKRQSARSAMETKRLEHVVKVANV